MQARSSVAEHCFDVAGVSGSNPLAPTKKWLIEDMKVENKTNKTMRDDFTMIDPELKKKRISEFAHHDRDTGSAAVQVAALTMRIEHLTEHCRRFPKNISSRRGLIKLVSKRRKFLRYLERTNAAQYDQVTSRLGVRK